MRSLRDEDLRPLRRQPELDLADAQGQTIDELTEPVEFFFGGDDLLPKVEEALLGQEAGLSRRTCSSSRSTPSATTRSELVCFEARALFPEKLETGMQFEGLPRAAPRRACRRTCCTR